MSRDPTYNFHSSLLRESKLKVESKGNLKKKERTHNMLYIMEEKLTAILKTHTRRLQNICRKMLNYELIWV